jgi:hypothetical protein
VCALTADWEAASVAKPSIAAQVPQALDVEFHFAAELAFYCTVRLDHIANPAHFLLV